MSPQCFLCAGEVGADGAAVCGGCARRHLSTVPVRATGEFVVPAMPADLDSGPAPGAPGAGSCTWCGKDGSAVKKLLGNGTVSICDECVALCADVMDAELGDGWRPDR
jgi:hypothetical protein